jgi:hypothetical protein
MNEEQRMLNDEVIFVLVSDLFIEKGMNCKKSSFKSFFP